MTSFFFLFSSGFLSANLSSGIYPRGSDVAILKPSVPHLPARNPPLKTSPSPPQNPVQILTEVLPKVPQNPLKQGRFAVYTQAPPGKWDTVYASLTSTPPGHRNPMTAGHDNARRIRRPVAHAALPQGFLLVPFLKQIAEHLLQLPTLATEAVNRLLELGTLATEILVRASETFLPKLVPTLVEVESDPPRECQDVGDLEGDEAESGELLARAGPRRRRERAADLVDGRFRGS